MLNGNDASSRGGAVAVCCMLSGLACGLPDFDLNRDIQEQRVPGSPLSGLLDDLMESPIPMDVDIAEETAARDAGPASSAHLSALQLRITDSAEPAGDEDDFGFLSRVEVWVESNREGTTLTPTLIAVWEDPPGGRVLDFAVKRQVDVLPFAEEGARFTSSVEGSVPEDDVTFDGSYRITVELL